MPRDIRFPYDRKYRLIPTGGRRASEEEKAIAEVINFFYEQGLIDRSQLEEVREYSRFRLQQMKEVLNKQGPDVPTGRAYIDLLESSADFVNATIFAAVRGKAILYDASNGDTLAQSEVSNGSFEEFISSPGVLIEVLAELIGIILSVVARVPGGAKKKITDAAGKAIADPNVRRLLAELIDLLRKWKPNRENREKLRKLLGDLMRGLKGVFKDLLGEIFSGLGWKDILLLLLDIVLGFTPIGWAKRGAEFLVGMLALTGSLVSKYESFQAGTA